MSRLGIIQVVLTVLSLLGWSLAIYALIIFGEARPDRAVGYFLSKGASVLCGVTSLCGCLEQ